MAQLPAKSRELGFARRELGFTCRKGEDLQGCVGLPGGGLEGLVTHLPGVGLEGAGLKGDTCLTYILIMLLHDLSMSFD